jgi:hypothetical protein
MNKVTSTTVRDALVQALRGLLMPLVRLLIRYQVTFPALRDLLKALYVEAASSMIEADGEVPSHSRLFILTGVHRKDIKRLLEQPNDDNAPLPDLSLGGELVARWTAQAEFTDGDGQPRALARSGSDDEPGFDQLVREASKDIRPRAMLDEWLRQGIVRLENDRVILNQQAFVPSADFDKLCYYLERNLRDHLETATHNLAGEGDPLLERSVYYGRLTTDSVERLREQAYASGMDLLEALNKQAMHYYQQDKDRDDATHRFRFGCYWHEQEVKS